jgi:hypothetical protein
MIALVLLALVFTVSSRSVDEVEKDAETWVKNQSALSPAIKALYAGINNLLMKFDCDRGDKDCGAWQAGVLIQDMTLSGKDECDKASSALCKVEKKLLGDKRNKMTKDEIEKVLAEKHKMMLDNEENKRMQATLVKHLNEIWNAMTDYVCFKVPSECNAAR